jgi:hypothetical protein
MIIVDPKHTSFTRKIEPLIQRTVPQTKTRTRFSRAIGLYLGSKTLKRVQGDGVWAVAVLSAIPKQCFSYQI